MKKKEFEAIGKGLSADLPGLAVKGQLLFMRPVGHTLRGIFLDSSINPGRFYVQIFIQPLFVPAKHVGFNIGWRLGGGAHTWDANSSTLLAELNGALKREALPFLLRIHSPRNVVDAATSIQKSQDPYVQQAVAYAFARSGDVKQAVDALDRLAALLCEDIAWQWEMADRARALKSRLVSDPAGAQVQLDNWEAKTVENLGLEGFR
jgi:hypothetical protein